MRKDGIHIEVIASSIKSVNRAIDALDKNIHDAARKVIAQAGLTIQKDAKRAAPVDFGVLRASVYFDYKSKASIAVAGVSTVGRRSGQTRMNFEIPRVDGKSSRDGLDVIVGSSLNYAGKQNKKTKFLTDAYNKTKDKVSAEVDKAIEQAINKSGMK